MTHAPSSICASCRFINYTRVAGEQPRDITCGNPELEQRHARPNYDQNRGTFGPDIIDIGPFRPPNLAFSCNRYAERAPDIGMTPTRLRD